MKYFVSGIFRNPDTKATSDLTCECDIGRQGASRSIKAHGPKDAREFEPQVLQLENGESPIFFCQITNI